MIGVEKKQKVYVLFAGVFCVIMSFILMVASFKIIRPISGFPLEEYIIISVSIYIAILVFGGIYHRIALQKGYYLNKSSNSRKGLGIIMMFSALGLLVGRVISRSVTEQLGTIIFALCVLILGYLMELGIHNLFKFYLIKKCDSFKIV